MNRVLKYIFPLLFIGISPALACSNSEIPYEVEQLSNEPYEPKESLISFTVSLPKTHKGWQLESIFFQDGKSNIPMFISDPDENNNVTTYLYTSKEELKKIKVEATYSPIPDGTGALSLCRKWQKINFGI